MKRLRSPACLSLLFALLVSVMPASATAVEHDRLEAFLEVTGFDVALESIALSAEHAPMMLGMEASDFGTNWDRIVAGVFDVELMQETAIDMLATTLSDDLLAHAAGFYASDLGQRLVAVENASHLHPDDEARRRMGEALITASESGPGSRTELLTELNEAVDSAGLGVRAVQELQLRFLMAASHAGVLGYEIDEQALRAVLSEGEPALRESMKKAGLSGSAYTYRDINDADLMAYRDALRDPRMQQVYELMNAIQHEITVDRFEALADKLSAVTGGEDL